MQRTVRVLVVIAAVCGPGVGPVAAEDRLGVDVAFGAGGALGPSDSGHWGDGQAAARLGVGVDLHRRVDGPWLLGGAASASAEVWDGGVGCGTITEGVVVAVGLVCGLSTIGLHGLAGLEVDLDPRTRLKAAAGLGATTFFLSAAFEDSIERTLAPSALLEVQAIRRIDGDGWLGLSLEARALTDEERRVSVFAALIVARR